MSSAFLEHVNVTVSDPEATAKRLESWFGWKVRWKGASLGGGTTYHIGNETSYVAAYSPPGTTSKVAGDSYSHHGGLNHIAVVVTGTKAILTGHVRSWAEREQAGLAAWSSPHVTDVVNRLVVEDH